jgi:hypothetical protein
MTTLLQQFAREPAKDGKKERDGDEREAKLIEAVQKMRMRCDSILSSKFKIS